MRNEVPGAVGHLWCVASDPPPDAVCFGAQGRSGVGTGRQWLAAGEAVCKFPAQPLAAQHRSCRPSRSAQHKPLDTNVRHDLYAASMTGGHKRSRPLALADKRPAAPRTRGPETGCSNGQNKNNINATLGTQAIGAVSPARDDGTLCRRPLSCVVAGPCSLPWLQSWSLP